MKPLPTLFLLLSLLLTWLPGTEAQGSNLSLPFTEHLDTDGMVTLRWGFSEVEQNITFQLSVNTTGWVGFGLSPNGDMRGADIVIGGVGPNGTYFTDRHGVEQSLPPVDQEQSYTLLSLTEEEGLTSMTFCRSIPTCDKDDFPITQRPIKLIYAYGSTDDIRYHATCRGTKEVNLLRYMPRTRSPDDNYLNIIVENVTVIPYHTYYHCKVLQIPNISGKHHVYRIDPVIENLDLVHHIILYRCPSTMNTTYNGQCYQGDDFEQCFSMIHGWGVGGGPFELPENAGISIGGEKDGQFYRLQIHYNNPTMAAGRKDNSGMRLYYTSQLREHDVGMLNTGLMVNSYAGYAIPPNATDFHTYSVCNTSHFSELMNGPIPDLHVFSVLLHTHLAGRKVRAGLFRGGEQVDFLGVDENYNFEYQEAYNLGNIKTIKPGDNILVECTYDTVNRTKPTWGGLATTDEMCLAFLLYYPAIDVSNCWSHPNMYYLAGTQGKTLVEFTEELMNKNWTQDDITNHEVLMKTIPQYEVVSDIYNNLTMIGGLKVWDMMKTPTVTCRGALGTGLPNVSQPVTQAATLSNNASHRERSSLVVASAGCLLLWLYMTGL